MDKQLIDRPMTKFNFTQLCRSALKSLGSFVERRTSIGIILMLTITVCLHAQPAPPAGQTWNLVVNDDFNSFNTTTWGYGSTPWGSENQSSCTLIPAADTYVSGGNLVLRSRTGTFIGSSGKTFPYSSGWAWLKTWRQYGYIEIRAQYPNNRGNWAAFWMLADGWPPEIDVAEFRGRPKNYMTMAFYDGTWNTSTRTADYTGWHTYGVEWSAGTLKYYIDGVLYKTVNKSTVPATPMYVILSNGTDCADTDGTGFPNYYNIDYFRWYQLSGTPTLPTGTTVEIVNRNSGKCLHTLNSATANGAQVVQYDCNGNASSKWTINQVSSGVYSIVNNASGRYADISNASTTAGANNIIWTSNGGNNQRWNITSAGAGYYNIRNVHSGMLLDISGASTANNARNIQWTNNSGTNQQWTIRTTSSSARMASTSAESIDLTNEGESNVTVYPNPSKSGNFFVKVPASSNVIIEIYNAHGKLLFQQSASGRVLEVKESLPAGIYTVKVKYHKSSISRKLVIN